jgi:hypothetical protein
MNFVRMSDGVVGLLVLFSVATYAVAVDAHGKMDPAGTDPAAKTVVDANGNLRVPTDYRTKYQPLGSWGSRGWCGQESNPAPRGICITRYNCGVSQG